MPEVIRFPGFRYGPDGARKLCQTAADVPYGWTDIRPTADRDYRGNAILTAGVTVAVDLVGDAGLMPASESPDAAPLETGSQPVASVPPPERVKRRYVRRQKV